jgi:hypothetical protein
VCLSSRARGKASQVCGRNIDAWHARVRLTGAATRHRSHRSCDLAPKPGEALPRCRPSFCPTFVRLLYDFCAGARCSSHFLGDSGLLVYICNWEKGPLKLSGFAILSLRSRLFCGICGLAAYLHKVNLRICIVYGLMYTISFFRIPFALALPLSSRSTIITIFFNIANAIPLKRNFD